MKQHAEKPSYIRKTGIESVINLLNSFFERPQTLCDAIRMIDRTIGGLLANKESPSYHGYRDYAATLFPSGLEATRPGRDIILILNNKEAIITRNGKESRIQIPSELKHPEKGVAQIIGQGFARLLFQERGKILTQLIEENGSDWQENAAANDDAQVVLNHYNPYQTETHSYIRKAEIDSLRTILKKLPDYAEFPLCALDVIDKKIEALLMNSITNHVYRDYAAGLFSSALDVPLPGKDIVLILNGPRIDVPPEFKNLEKRVALIIGHHFARTLFMVRGNILIQLITTEKHGDDWQVNAKANDDALAVLKSYDPYHVFFDMAYAAKAPCSEPLLFCFQGR